MNMRIKLVQLDGAIMNLALSKLATWHKHAGDKVGLTWCDRGDYRKHGFTLGMPNPDRIYYSAVFSWTAESFKQQKRLDTAEVICGGYPFNDVKLPLSAEHAIPAYELWGVDYSLGYTSRGCIRNCGFCIVPSKEGNIYDYESVEHFHHPGHKKLILMDNNFFASPKWRENLSYIHDNGLKVNFNQGLDLRLITEEIAKLLKDTKCMNHNFNERKYYGAFDSLSNETQIRKGLQHLLDAGIKANSIAIFVLVGYDSTDAEDFKRCSILWDEYHVHPFVMKYNKRNDSEFLNHLARWANRPAARRNHTFEEYCMHQIGRTFTITGELT